MSNLISRLYNWVTDRSNNVKITDTRMDAEFNQIVTALNRKVLIASTAPTNPINGQTWVDSTNNLVKAYLNNEWVIISNKVYIQSSAPSSPDEGALWYDTAENVLKTYNGSTWNTVGDMIFPSGTVQGDILYLTAEKTLARLAKNTNASRVLANNGTNNNPAWSQIDTNMLKTATGEVSSTSGNTYGAPTILTLPGGEYGFWIQTKMSSTSTGVRTISSGSAEGEDSFAGWTSYATKIRIGTGVGGETVYAQQRYITASGSNHWLFMLVDKITKDIVCSYSAPDHPAYGNGGDFNKVQHPFEKFDSEKYFICIADNESIAEIKKLVTREKSLLTLVNEDFKVGEVDCIYEPLHSGKFLAEDKDGKQYQVKEMVTTLPDFIKVRKLIKYTDEEKVKLG